MRTLAAGSIAALAIAVLAARTSSGQAPGFDVAEKSIVELQQAMTSGQVTSRQLVDAFLARVDAYDQRGPGINAMVSLNPRARETAEALDRERAAKGPRGPLHGIPIVVKDNYNTADMPTTGSTLGLAGFTPARDAFLVKRLREAGAVILGKTNLHELAAGITSISSYGGQTRNPYDPTRNAGGSSGGTGAAVGASFAAFGMGSDTCGSIRIPSSHASLVGLRGTAGLSSRDGIIPLSHTQDIGGPLARTAEDLAIALDATVGADPNDPATAAGDGRRPGGFRAALREDALKGARIGVLSAYFTGDGVDSDMTGTVRAALDDMKKAGAELVEVSVPDLDALTAASGLIAYEFKFDLIDYLAREPSAPVKSLAEILDGGLYHAALEQTFRRRNAVEERDSEAYRKALAAREQLAHVLTVLLTAQRLDAIAYPTMRRRPAKLGEPQSGSTCQVSAQSGLPAISLPAGFTPEGLPAGLELLGLPWSDARLVSLAYALERASPRRRAPLYTPPLVNGRPPAPVTIQAGVVPGEKDAPRVGGTFEFDRVTGRLRFEIAITGAAPGEVLAVTLHRGADGEAGPALYRLLGTGLSSGSGTIDLTPRDRADLVEGRLHVRVHTRTRYPGGLRLPLPQSLAR